MPNIRLTKRFTFETGHALYGYDGKCRNVHGHGYKLYVTILGKPITDAAHVKHGMVMDFGDLKKIVNEEIVDRYDHAMVFNKNSPHKALGEALSSQGHQVILADFQPTSEFLVSHFAEVIQKRLPDHIQLFSVKLQETDTSYAEWFAADNE